MLATLANLGQEVHLPEHFAEHGVDVVHLHEKKNQITSSHDEKTHKTKLNATKVSILRYTQTRKTLSVSLVHVYRFLLA